MREHVDEAVLNRMRHILVVYRDTWRGETNKAFGWGDLAAMIVEHTLDSTGNDINFPQTSLENFARGLPHSDKNKRDAGIKKYSMPGPERLQAIVLFLTEPESDGFFCRKEELFSLADLQAPVFLLDFLHNKQSPDHYLSATALKGEFVSTDLDADSNLEIKTTLQFLGATSNSLAQIDILKEGADNGDITERYVGWGVITPEENLLLVAKKLKSDRNLYFWSLGIDQAIYRNSPPEIIKSLVFLEHEFPVDTVASDADGDLLLDAIRKTWAQQIRLFKRTLPSSTDLTCDQEDSTDE